MGKRKFHTLLLLCLMAVIGMTAHAGNQSCPISGQNDYGFTYGYIIDLYYSSRDVIGIGLTDNPNWSQEATEGDGQLLFFYFYPKSKDDLSGLYRTSDKSFYMGGYASVSAGQETSTQITDATVEITFENDAYTADYQFRYENGVITSGKVSGICAAKSEEPEAYAVFDEQIRTLTYYYDKNRAEYDATILLPWTDEAFYEEHKTDIGRILIDESFKNAPLKSSQGLFHYSSGGSYNGLPYVGEINGLEYLDTKTMTDLMWLFAGMEGIEELDLTKMDLSDIITAPGMFVNCYNLKKIICDADLSGIEDGFQMFYGCSNLVGGLGTACDGENIVSQAYARPDEEGKPGYFTSSKQGLDEISQQPRVNSQKLIRNGILLIERGGKTYNAQGAEIR